MRHATIVCNGVAIESNVSDLVFQGAIVPQQFDVAVAFSDGSRLTLNGTRACPGQVASTPAATRRQPRSRVDGAPAD